MYRYEQTGEHDLSIRSSQRNDIACSWDSGLLLADWPRRAMRPSAKANHDAARLYAESLRDIMEPLRHKTTREIARELHEDGFRTAKGYEFSSMQVWRILKRLGTGQNDT